MHSQDPKMIAPMFLVLGLLLFVLVFKAFSTREIRARGWGFSARTYCRDDEPVMYWVTFASFLVLAIWTTVFGFMAVLGRSF